MDNHHFDTNQKIGILLAFGKIIIQNRYNTNETLSDDDIKSLFAIGFQYCRFKNTKDNG